MAGPGAEGEVSRRRRPGRRHPAGDGKRLGELAETYLAAAAALRVAPDRRRQLRAGPGAVAALSFLVDAEAARVGQAATVLPDPAQDRLSTIARRLTLIGERLLEPELRGRARARSLLLEDPTFDFAVEGVPSKSVYVRRNVLTSASPPKMSVGSAWAAWESEGPWIGLGVPRSRLIVDGGDRGPTAAGPVERGSQAAYCGRSPGTPPPPSSLVAEDDNVTYLEALELARRGVIDELLRHEAHREVARPSGNEDRCSGVRAPQPGDARGRAR